MSRRIQELLDDPTPRIPERDPATSPMRMRRVQAGDIAVLFRAERRGPLRRRFSPAGNRLLPGRRPRLLCPAGGVRPRQSLCVLERSGRCGRADRHPCDRLFSVSPTTRSSPWPASAVRCANRLLPPRPPICPNRSRSKSATAARVLDELLRKKDRLPLAHLLELAVERTGYDASLLHEFLGRRKVANLRKLIDMAREFDRSGLGSSGRGTLSDFAQRLRDSISEETVEELAATHPETSNVVRLMTIHQAKGTRVPRGDRRGHGSPEPGTGVRRRSTTANSVRCFLRRPREPKSRGTSPSR